MFIIKLSYKVPLSEVDKYLQTHREFLDTYYKKGLLLVSGPMNPRTGGIIIALSKDKDTVITIFQQDPYYLADIAEYEFIEFNPVKYGDEMKELIQKMEGNLC